MTAVVIDTNVIAVADELHGEVSSYCVSACARALENASKMHRVVIDDGRRILREYEGNVTKARQKTPGMAFLKWLYQNMWTPERCDQITLTVEGDETEFAEFPNHPALRAQVDRSDRVFIAVAYAHPEKPPILQATDSKWLDWESDLKACGLSVKFLCPEDIKRFHAAKAKKR